jgi:hypothetical protein
MRPGTHRVCLPRLAFEIRAVVGQELGVGRPAVRLIDSKPATCILIMKSAATAAPGNKANALDRQRYDVVTLAAVADDTPLAHARGRGYKEMAQILEKAGAR